MEESQGTMIQEGDVVLFHTGWLMRILKLIQQSGFRFSEVDVHIAGYLRKVVQLELTFSVEAVPAAVGRPSFPAHGVCFRRMEFIYWKQ